MADALGTAIFYHNRGRLTTAAAIAPAPRLGRPRQWVEKRSFSTHWGAAPVDYFSFQARSERNKSCSRLSTVVPLWIWTNSMSIIRAQSRI